MPAPSANFWFWLVAVVLGGCLAFASRAAAGDHHLRICLPKRCPCDCCPDYVGKPWPCLPCPAPQCCCDDYCAKPLPGFCPVPACLCDDYCRKPIVCLPGIPCYPWYKCLSPPNCSPAAK